MLTELHPYAIALSLGMVIGAEREFNNRDRTQVLGVRTFPLIAVLGVVAASLPGTALAAVIAAGVFLLVALSYWRSTQQQSGESDPGVTTEIAAIVVFCMGYIIYNNTQLGTALGISTLALLAARSWLHTVVREKLHPADVHTGTVLLVAIFGIGPFLPDHTIDPWGILNPRRTLVLFSLIGLVQFLGYAAVRVWGTSAGHAISGFLGGFVSSTAVFISLKASLTRKPQAWRSLFAGAFAATAATIIELAFILSIAALPLLEILWLPLASIIALCLAIVALLLLRQKRESADLVVENGPPHFLSVVKLGLLLTLLMAAVNLSHRYLTAGGVWLLAFFSGLFELHGVSLALAIDATRSTEHVQSAATAVGFAVAASFVSKIGILLVGLRNRLAVYFSLVLAGVCTAGLATVLLPLRG
jgi:uncharacterized membrane protein (DUF4010 family)